MQKQPLLFQLPRSPYFFFAYLPPKMMFFPPQILSVFALQLSVVFVTAIRSPLPYYGPISSKHKPPKHSPGNFALNVAFENFREVESGSLEDEVREVLSQIVPVALTAAIKKENPYHVLAGISDEGWNIIQSTLVQISSILYCDDLTFVGGSGGMDSSELWENSCRDGRNDAAVWHGYKTSSGNKEGSNTITICPSFFEKQGIASIPHRKRTQYLCEDMDPQKSMELRSAILLRELSQTLHVGGRLRPDNNQIVQRIAAGPPGDAQEVLHRANTKVELLNQVDVELFNRYVILTWRRSVCGQDEKHPQFDWMHSEQ